MTEWYVVRAGKVLRSCRAYDLEGAKAILGRPIFERIRTLAPGDRIVSAASFALSTPEASGPEACRQGCGRKARNGYKDCQMCQHARAEATREERQPTTRYARWYAKLSPARKAKRAKEQAARKRKLRGTRCSVAGTKRNREHQILRGVINRRAK